MKLRPHHHQLHGGPSGDFDAARGNVGTRERLTRTEAEAIFAQGCDVVVEALLRMDARIRALSEQVSKGEARGRALHDSAELPERLASVVLIPPDGRQIPARVSEHRADALVLVAVVPVSAFNADELAAMVLEYGIPEGRMRLAGSFTCPNPAAPESLMLEHAVVLDVIQERDFLRVNVARSAHLLLQDGDGVPLPTTTVNIGAGGMLLDGPRTLQAGSKVAIEIGLMPGESPVRAHGRIVRNDHQGRPAIVFDAIDPLDHRRLERFVTDQRLAEGFGPG